SELTESDRGEHEARNHPRRRRGSLSRLGVSTAPPPGRSVVLQRERAGAVPQREEEDKPRSESDVAARESLTSQERCRARSPAFGGFLAGSAAMARRRA